MRDSAEDGGDYKRWGDNCSALLLAHILRRPIALVEVETVQSQETVAQTDLFGRPLFDENDRLLTTTRFGVRKQTGSERLQVFGPDFKEKEVINFFPLHGILINFKP